MPLLFSYGTLQLEEVQLKTLGRALAGTPDAIRGFEAASVKIEDPEMAAALGRTHHANVRFTGDDTSQVTGTVFDITDGELAKFDAFERVYFYVRVLAPLASGRKAWVYVYP
jgi:gamma-glutamylcyclotransferase (GGCT)/AIG2-like uncharacterized protein YtfP